MTQWQPIETAPRDGTRILLADHFLFAAGHCSIEDGREFWIESGCSAFHEDSATENYNGPLYFKPTHWMPLPDPPSGKP